MNEEENLKQLYVPANIKTRYEFMSGFGFIELVPTVIVGVISIVIAIILNNVFNYGIHGIVLGVCIITIFTGTCLRKGETNQSVIDMIGLFIKFSGSQQKYLYEYIDLYVRVEQ